MPQIVVDGQPTRARIFWGSPRPGQIKTTPQWQQQSFEFTASGDAANGTMHFRFGRTPGEIFLDDIRVLDMETNADLIPLCDFEAGESSFTRDWTYWPTDASNTVGSAKVVTASDGGGSLRIKLVPPPDGTWPDYHIYHQPRLKIQKGHRYHVSFRVRSEPARSLHIAFYRPGQSYTLLGGPEGPFASQIKLAADAGVNWVSFPVSLPWPEPGTAADLSTAVAQCEAVLHANPRALLLPRISMDPPAWWSEAHPDDAMQWEDGRRGSMVVASPQYRRDAAERLAALVAHLEQRFGDHIAGYHPAGQNTGEWFYQDTWKPQLSGYAPADVAAWRAWLKQRYSADGFWNDPSVRLNSVEVPAVTARRAAPNGMLRDPSSEQQLIDWAEFQQQAMADCVCELAKAVRSATAGKKLVLFFYGYIFEFAGAPNGPAVSGHYALRRALDCPDIDVLCAPISYMDRGLGQNAPTMTAAESVALAGKLWLNEDDTHTYLATEDFPGSREHVMTLEETNAQLIRNVAQASLRNFATWWMDLGSSGWFNDAGMWQQIKRLSVLDDAMLAQPTPFHPEIAAIIDERSMLHVTPAGSAVTGPGVYEVRRALGRMGAPYGQYLLDDLLAGKVKAKVYVILNAWRLSAEQREALKTATRNATVIWCYAPGYLDDTGPSLDAMKDLTGFALEKESTDAWAEPSAEAKQLGVQQGWGTKRPVQPLFAATNAGREEILATYPNGATAAAVRRSPDGNSIFVGAPGLTPEILRLAANIGGAHLFTQVDCNVYANGRFLTVHASQDGPLTIDVGEATNVTDLLSGETLGAGPRITVPIRRGETRILKY